jgi:predicted DsbA family dithiol-disulfide isomerase
MKVEVWSDIICPFCYIGKRKFEQALHQFAHQSEVEVVWRSYQLDPSTPAFSTQSVAADLARKKGMSLSETKQMMQHVTDMASEVGLVYDFDKAVVANTFTAHRLTHLAAKHGLQDASEERLFTAYFTEGKNINDLETLVQLGVEIGLDAEEVRSVLVSDAYTKEVQQDIYEAQQVGVRGVPFFVFDNKYAVSGAQSSEVFTNVLQKVWSEQPALQVLNFEGSSCDTEGNCD